MFVLGDGKCMFSCVALAMQIKSCVDQDRQFNGYSSFNPNCQITPTDLRNQLIQQYDKKKDDANFQMDVNNLRCVLPDIITSVEMAEAIGITVPKTRDKTRDNPKFVMPEMPQDQRLTVEHWVKYLKYNNGTTFATALEINELGLLLNVKMEVYVTHAAQATTSSYEIVVEKYGDFGAVSSSTATIIRLHSCKCGRPFDSGEGNHFNLITNHANVRSLMQQPNLSSKRSTRKAENMLSKFVESNMIVFRCKS
jgi:hypothetical protein